MDGNESLVRDLAELFLAEGPGWMRELTEGLRSNDAGLVKRMAHNLKGSLSIVAARNAHEAALELEALARTGNLIGADAAFAALQQAIDQVLPVLTRLIQEGSSGPATRSPEAPGSGSPPS
jgi:HPt (histidine-containing phosphotransfer) domain-containing protein